MYLCQKRYLEILFSIPGVLKENKHVKGGGLLFFILYSWPAPSPPALSVRPQPPTPKWTSRGVSLNFSFGILRFPYQKEISIRVPPAKKLFRGTGLPNNFFVGGTVPPNSFTLKWKSIITWKGDMVHQCKDQIRLYWPGKKKLEWSGTPP